VLWKRFCRAVISAGDTQVTVEDLSIQFEIHKGSSDNAQNKSSVTILNLNKTTRAILSRPASTIQLFVAYGSTNRYALIASGDVTEATHTHTPPQWETRLLLTDSVVAQETVLNKSYPEGVSGILVLRDIISQIPRLVPPAGMENLKNKRFQNGLVVSGSAMECLRKIAKAMGYSVVTEGRQIFFLDGNNRVGQARRRVFAQGSGLIGIPSSTEGEGIRFISLIDPSVSVGDTIELRTESSDFSGTHVIRQITYRGDTRGNDWYMECLCGDNVTKDIPEDEDDAVRQTEIKKNSAPTGRGASGSF